MTQEHPITPPPELVKQWAEYQGFEHHPEVLWLKSPPKPPAGALIRSWRRAVSGFKSFTKLESWVKHDLKHFRTARRPASRRA
jgi:hypothetical protein